MKLNELIKKLERARKSSPVNNPEVRLGEYLGSSQIDGVYHDDKSDHSIIVIF
jgi:hypothetical protein